MPYFKSNVKKNERARVSRANEDINYKILHYIRSTMNNNIIIMIHLSIDIF